MIGDKFEGIIEKMDINTGKSGKEYAVLSIGGARYSTIKMGILEGMEQGDYVKGTFVRNGQYKNLNTIEKAKAPVSAQPPKTAPAATARPREDFKAVMGDSIVACEDLRRNLPVDEGFKSALDWTEIVTALFRAKAWEADLARNGR